MKTNQLAILFQLSDVITDIRDILVHVMRSVSVINLSKQKKNVSSRRDSISQLVDVWKVESAVFSSQLGKIKHVGQNLSYKPQRVGYRCTQNDDYVKRNTIILFCILARCVVTSLNFVILKHGCLPWIVSYLIKYLST